MARILRRTITTIVWVVVATACAQRVPATSGRTVTVGLDDAGATVSLDTGDHLVIQVGASSAASRAEWKLVHYPESSLRQVSSDPAEGRFEFEATAAGQGQIVLAGQPGCDGGALSGEEGLRCPVTGPALGGAAIPILRFAVTVQVT